MLNLAWTFSRLLLLTTDPYLRPIRLACVSASANRAKRYNWASIVGSHLRSLALTLAGLTAVVAAACAPNGELTPTSEVEPPMPSPAATATATPAQTPTARPPFVPQYDSTRNMYLLYSGLEQDFGESRQAVELALANMDKSMVPVMVEMLRFFGTGELVTDTSEAMTTITGFRPRNSSRPWHEWMEWLGKNADDYHPPEGYVEWKSALMSEIDLRFAEFLLPAAQGSRINVFEIAWGGVVPDGIPDLQNAPVVAADEQDYLLPGDRVFGVSINGEHRAYPLRIVNAHEMANDVLGGEPVALAY